MGAGRQLASSLLLLALAACGTTVPSAGPVPGDGVGLQGGGSLSATPAAGAGAGLSAPGSSASAVAAGGGGGTSSAAFGQRGGAVPGSSSSSPPTVAAPRRPVGKASGTPVRIGFTLAPDADQFFAAFGADVSTGSQQAELQAAVDWVNTHGGLNGHKLVPVIETVSVTSTETYDQQYQSLCTRYTQDDKVIAATMIGIGANSNMDRCMSRARTLFVTGSHTLHDQNDYADTPYAVSPGEATSTSVAQAATSLILDRALEKKGRSVGMINYDIPEYNRAVESIVKPQLKAAGIGLVQYTIPPPASTQAIGNSVAVVQSAALKMRSQNVQNVMFLCAGCLSFFAQTASSQDYYPRYLFSTLDNPVSMGGSNNKQVYGTSLGVGYEPFGDQDTYKNAKAFTSNKTYNLCRQIEKANITSATSLAASMFLCGDVMAIYDAARGNPVEPLTADSLRKGLLTPGAHTSPMSFSTALGPDRHAGATQYKVLSWLDACACMAYEGPVRTFAR